MRSLFRKHMWHIYWFRANGPTQGKVKYFPMIYCRFFTREVPSLVEIIKCGDYSIQFSLYATFSCWYIQREWLSLCSPPYIQTHSIIDLIYQQNLCSKLLHKLIVALRGNIPSENVIFNRPCNGLWIFTTNPMLSRNEKVPVFFRIWQKNNRERKKKAHDSYWWASLDDYQENKHP